MHKIGRRLFFLTGLFFVAHLSTGCVSVGAPAFEALVFPLTEPTTARELNLYIDAKDIWNDHGIKLVKGESYQLSVSSPDPQWCDALKNSRVPAEMCEGIPSSLDKGWAETKSLRSKFIKHFFFLRRCPQEPWYALTGVIQEVIKDKVKNHCFLIGKGDENFTADATGRLFIFANDSLPKTYENNGGGVHVSIIKKSVSTD